RWGQRRWEPRLQAVRDNGILIFCVGEHGAQSRYWMRSQELQVQEGDIGDWWPLAGAIADIPLRTGNPAKPRAYDPKGAVTAVTARVRHGADYQEKPFGEWNVIECYALAGDAVFRLNGRTVNVLLNSRFREKGSSVELPLKSGKIQVQSEAAECEYRRMEIRPLPAWPTEVSGDVPKR
ncbi:MAG: N-acetylneuraminate epimerase, partial [Verrucomicrobiota bacterium]